jgi:hypothetical protein
MGAVFLCFPLFYFVFLVRIGTFQWVTRDSGEEFSAPPGGIESSGVDQGDSKSEGAPFELDF